MIPDSFKQDLLNRVDIVEVVSRCVQLKKGGANFQGLCPFHSEKTPSFTVSPAKQFYHCLGCGAHGNAIGFLMAYSSLGYVDAVKELAASVGLQVPDERPRSAEEVARKEREPDLYAVMEKAMDFYRAELKRSPRAIDYLRGRGVAGEIAARFGIGYAPDGWQGLKEIFQDYSDSSLVECGLVIESEGKRYDRFRDRVMFPIFNSRGNAVIGFGGRVLDSGEPKYLNSPETPLFQKGREVYGLARAIDAIRSGGRVLVVEGYMDVVALAQFGVGYAVATLGTATTPVHVAKLLRLADEVVFCFDGDAAGRKAAWRALEVSLPLAPDNKKMRFLFLQRAKIQTLMCGAMASKRLKKWCRKPSSCRSSWSASCAASPISAPPKDVRSSWWRRDRTSRKSPRQVSGSSWSRKWRGSGKSPRRRRSAFWDCRASPAIASPRPPVRRRRSSPRRSRSCSAASWRARIAPGGSICRSSIRS